MNVIKRIFNYGIWTLIALLLTIGYMRIILGPPPEPSNNFMRMFDWVYSYVFIHVGLIIGSIVTFLFILIDIVFLNRKLEHKANKNLIRLLIMISISIITGGIHYLLEKVIDVI
ncbi:hypothetical protein [Psychroserpens damuponensis]|uniref:hypothetical protein n=1 Tax=Psychroserpens damuponensis TaxID=943936 RepID=UPI00058FA9F4|nr:hypothetical protein [Psychroserpens damuponensis]